MKKIIQLLLIISSTQVFSFDRIGNVIEEDNLFHYKNYDRVQYHKLRENEYNILTDKIKLIGHLKKENKDDSSLKSELQPEKEYSLVPEQKIEAQDSVMKKSESTSMDNRLDPLSIQDSDIINISY